MPQDATNPDLTADPVRRTGAVVLAAGKDTSRGGQSMRWRALRQAIGRHRPCSLHEIRCNRWERCGLVCAAGGPEPQIEDGDWFYDRAFCASYAGALAAELRASGVSTVVASGLETARYVAAFGARGDFTTVFDLHNVELVLHEAIHDAAPADSFYAKVYSAEHLHRVAEVERLALDAADEIWVCSEVDRRLVLDTYAGLDAGRIHVVPNAVAVDEPPPPGGEVRRLCFTGRLDYFPNVQAAWTLVSGITPLTRELGHDLPVVVAGAQARETLGYLSLSSGVRFVSNPDDMSAIVRDSIMVVPLETGGGSRLKVLEAFSLGAPVVSTPKGVEGLDAVPGVHYLEATDPPEFARSVDSLLGDAGLRDRLRAQAWRLVADRYSIDAISDRLRHLAADRPRRRGQGRG